MSKMNGLEKMSLAELKDLRVRLDQAIVAAEASEKEALRQEFAALATRRGLTISDVLGTEKGRGGRKGTVVPIKYRNPQDPTQTWSGRGRQPIWLVEAIKKGRKRESFLVA